MFSSFFKIPYFLDWDSFNVLNLSRGLLIFVLFITPEQHLNDTTNFCFATNCLNCLEYFSFWAAFSVFGFARWNETADCLCKNGYNARNSRLQCTSVTSLAKRDNVTDLCNFKQQLRDLFCYLYRKDTAVIDNILRTYALERKIFGFIILTYEPELYYDKWNLQKENHS